MDSKNKYRKIETLSKKDWEKLFLFIPRIESTKEFSKGGELIEDKNNPENLYITHEYEKKIVTDFRDVMEELGLLIPFSWSSWDYGKEIFEKGEYKGLDTITLLKLLYAFFRNDHFSYGAALASKFQDGTIKKILKELKKNIENK